MVVSIRLSGLECSLNGIDSVSMTLPDKPTSPSQRYVTTLKGRLLLQILQRIKRNTL